MDYLLGRLVRSAFRRGVGGPPSWLLLAGAAFVLRRALRREDPTVTRMPLSLGQTLEVTLRDPASPMD